MQISQTDIAFAIGLVSQFMHSPREDHLQAVFRILRSLNGHQEEDAYALSKIAV